MSTQEAAATYREPQNWHREDGSVVRRITIIGTPLDIYSLWEPLLEHSRYARFSTQTFMADGWYGQVGVGSDYLRAEYAEQAILETVPAARRGRCRAGTVEVRRDAR